MLHFTEDEETFRRFCLELLAGNPKLTELKKIGVDMEEAIFNGFKGILTNLLKLYCVRHLSQRDEVAISKLLEKSNKSSDNKAQCQKEIRTDIYGHRMGEVYDFGLAEAFDEDDFNAKLASLKSRWESLCPGFFNWFVTHRKKEFVESVIVSARDGTNVDGL